MRDKIVALKKLGAEVLVVDPHEVYRVRHMLKDAQRDGLAAFPILADPANIVSAMYGAAMQMRIHTEWSSRPVTVIVDRAGVVRYLKRGEKYSDRPKAEDIMAELEKL